MKIYSLKRGDFRVNMVIPVFGCRWACHCHPTETIADNQHFVVKISVIIATVDLYFPGCLVYLYTV